MPIFYTETASFSRVQITGSLLITGSGSNIFVVSGSSGPLFEISDVVAGSELLRIDSGSTTVLSIVDKNVFISGTLTVTGSLSATSFSGSLISTASWSTNALTSSYPIAFTGSTLYTVPTTAYNLSNQSTVAYGLNAGSGSSGGYDAVFVGTGAGTGATSAYRSIFIGSGSGFNATSANSSIFIGSEAGKVSGTSTANNTIMIGNSAGVSTSGASYGIIIGNGAGQAIGNAVQVIVLGASAGSLITNSDVSIMIGGSVGSNATSASGSIFMGYQTGQYGVGTSYSTLLGYQVGYGPNSGFAPGTNNIIIGSNITLEARRRDAINIGGILFGTGSYNAFPTYAYSGSVPNGRIGINVVNPSYTLDVSGSGNFYNNVTVTGSLTATSLSGSVSGSLFGTASWATSASRAISSSYALSASWAPSAAGGTPGGTTTQIQYNNAGAFAGVPVLTYDGTTLRATGSFSGSILTPVAIGSASINTTSSVTTAVGTVISSIATGSYNSAFYNYYLSAGSNFRAGHIVAAWSASVVSFNEFATADIGNTMTASFTASISGQNIQLILSGSSGWTVRTMATLL